MDEKLGVTTAILVAIALAMAAFAHLWYEPRLRLRFDFRTLVAVSVVVGAVIVFAASAWDFPPLGLVALVLGDSYLAPLYGSIAWLAMGGFLFALWKQKDDSGE